MDKLAAYRLLLEDHPLWTKIAGGLLSARRKLKEEGFIDPRSEEFASSQAFGKALLPSLATLPGAAISAVKGRPGLAGGLLATGAGLGAGIYAHQKNKYRKLQAQGLNPATGKPHDLKRIEKTRKWSKAVADRRRKGQDVKGLRDRLNRQVLEDG